MLGTCTRSCVYLRRTRSRMLAANDPGGAVFSMIYSLLARVSGGSAEAKACL